MDLIINEGDLTHSFYTYQFAIDWDLMESNHLSEQSVYLLSYTFKEVAGYDKLTKTVTTLYHKCDGLVAQYKGLTITKRKKETLTVKLTATSRFKMSVQEYRSKRIESMD